MAKIENDKYKITVAGVGYIGDINFKLKGNKVYDTWRSILYRCYNIKYSQYKYYGAKGVIVEEYLHSFENFYNHIKTLENYDKWLISEHYNLDKDRLSIDYKIYSRETMSIISYDENLRLAGKGSIKILCLNKNKEVITEYSSIYEASKKLNLPQSNIQRCLIKERISCGGFFWIIKDEYDENYKFRNRKESSLIGKPSKKKIKILQFDLNDNFIKKWNSLTEASFELKIPIASISKCINNPTKTTHSFKFKKSEVI